MTEKNVDELKELDEVKAMPIYPQKGSIKTVDGVLVVKLSIREQD